MTINILNVLYVLIAATMIGFILVQRGAGAQAGSGFGSGASATVFGARGSANFLTKSTAILATAFFVLSLVMGVLISRGSIGDPAADLGVMAGEVTAPAKADGAAAPAASTTPADGSVPAPTQNAFDVPAATPPAAAPAAAPAATPEAAKEDVPEAPKN